MVHYKLFENKFDIKDPNTIVYKIDGGNFAIYTNQSDSTISKEAANALTKKLISNKISEDIFKFFAPFASLPKKVAATMLIQVTPPIVITNQQMVLPPFIQPQVYQTPLNNMNIVETNFTTPLMNQQQQVWNIPITQVPVNNSRPRGSSPK